MNRLMTGALALAAVGSVGFAGTGDEDWTDLDQEISTLSSSLRPQGGGVDIGALIRSSYNLIDEDLLDDTGGFLFQDVDVFFESQDSGGEWSWRVNVDFDGGDNGGIDDVLDDVLMGGTVVSPDALMFPAFGFLGTTGGGAALEDAFAQWQFSDDIALTWGQFKSPTFLSNSVDPENQLFIQRTILGTIFDAWDLGAMLSGNYDQFSWYAAFQNGADGIMDEYRWTARGEYHVGAGAGGRRGVEGALGADEELNATIGVVLTDDGGLAGGTLDDTTIFGVDAAATYGQLSGLIEFASLDDEIGDTEIFALTAAYMFQPDEWEAALRYEDTGDLEITKLTGGLNWYQNGHNRKWSLNLSSIEADLAEFGGVDLDGTIIEIGLTIGSSRS